MVQKLHSSVKRRLIKAPRFSKSRIIQEVTKTLSIRVKFIRPLFVSVVSGTWSNSF